MTTELKQLTMGVDELSQLLEPLIRRIIREELANIVSESADIFYLQPESPLYEDMENILQRKAEGKLKFYSHEEVWNE